mgnify:CR=1 FL=1
MSSLTDGWICSLSLRFACLPWCELMIIFEASKFHFAHDVRFVIFIFFEENNQKKTIDNHILSKKVHRYFWQLFVKIYELKRYENLQNLNESQSKILWAKKWLFLSQKVKISNDKLWAKKKFDDQKTPIHTKGNEQIWSRLSKSIRRLISDIRYAKLFKTRTQ